ncbi:MAG: hypothetical protein ACW97Z_10570 [Candidatus Hodarchaeales archaeon]|jgi:hypothetical protein
MIRNAGYLPLKQVCGADVPGLALTRKDDVSSLLALILIQLFGFTTIILDFSNELLSLPIFFISYRISIVPITHPESFWWHGWHSLSNINV